MPRTALELLVPVWAIGIGIALRILVPRTNVELLLVWLTPAQRPRKPRPESIALALTYTLIVLKLIGWPSDGRCLPLALSLYHFGRHFGLPLRCHCGVRKEGSRLVGHAWLTLVEKPFLEDLLGQREFTPVYSYPSD